MAKLDEWENDLKEPKLPSQCERISVVGTLLSRNVEIRENYYKVQHRWYMTP